MITGNCGPAWAGAPPARLPPGLLSATLAASGAKTAAGRRAFGDLVVDDSRLRRASTIGEAEDICEPKSSLSGAIHARAMSGPTAAEPADEAPVDLSLAILGLPLAVPVMLLCMLAIPLTFRAR